VDNQGAISPFLGGVNEGMLRMWISEISFLRIQEARVYDSYEWVRSFFLRTGEKWEMGHSVTLRKGWVRFETNVRIHGEQYTKYFIEFIFVETNQLFSSNLNVILTRQTCGQRLGIGCGKQSPSARILFVQGALQVEGPTIFFWKEPDVDEKSENLSQQNVPCI